MVHVDNKSDRRVQSVREPSSHRVPVARGNSRIDSAPEWESSPSSVWGCLLLVRFHSTIRVGSTFGVAAGLPGVKADLNDSILEIALCFIINPITRILMGLVKFEPR